MFIDFRATGREGESEGERDRQTDRYWSVAPCMRLDQESNLQPVYRMMMLPPPEPRSQGSSVVS